MCTTAHCGHDWVQESHRRGFRAHMRDPIARHVQLRSGDHHGRDLRAPAWDPKAQHVLLRSGDPGAANVHLRGIRTFLTVGCSPAVQAAAAAVLALGVAVLLLRVDSRGFSYIIVFSLHRRTMCQPQSKKLH